MSTTSKYNATIITIYSLGVFLGLLHVFFGLVSISPALSQDYHREMKINFNAFAKSLSFLHEFVDRASLAYYLRLAVSASEIIFGLSLIENGHFTHHLKLGNYGLVVIDILYLLLQISVGSSYERIAPTIVFTVLLLTRLYFVVASQKKTKVGVKTRNAGKPKTSTPKKNKNE